MLSNLIITIGVKIKNMKKNHVFRGHVFPYIKSRGTGDTKMSANAGLITVEIYVQQGKTIENQFLIYGPKCKKKNYIIGYLRGPGGGMAFNYQTGSILLSSYPLTHIYVHVK